jgi:hypothetical protein
MSWSEVSITSFVWHFTLTIRNLTILLIGADVRDIVRGQWWKTLFLVEVSKGFYVHRSVYFHVCSMRHIGIEFCYLIWPLCMIAIPIYIGRCSWLEREGWRGDDKMLLCLAGNFTWPKFWYQELHGSVRKWSFPLTGDCGFALHCQTLNLRIHWGKVYSIHGSWTSMIMFIAHCSMIALITSACRAQSEVTRTEPVSNGLDRYQVLLICLTLFVHSTQCLFSSWKN